MGQSVNDQFSYDQGGTSVAVVGLGPMGRALAGALLRAGNSVRVWNRTPAKANDLVAQGATLAATPYDALSSCGAAVFCVLDDDAVAEIVTEAAAGGGLGHLTLINLTADSPARTRSLHEQVSRHGITLIDGAIMTPAAAIGTDTTRILYAGPIHAYETYRDLLSAFGGTSHYLGDDIAAAATYDVALLTLFWSSIAGLTQALALTRAEQLTAEDFSAHAVSMSQLVADLLPGLISDFAAERYSGSNSATIDSLSTSLEHLRAAFAQAQLPSDLLDTIHEHVNEAKQLGFGADAPIRLADTTARHRKAKQDQR